jgi:hypothetical protein
VLKFESPEEPRSLEENQVLGACIHVLFLGRISSRERLTEYDISELLDMDPLIAFSKSKETDHLDKVCQAFEQGSKRRRLSLQRKAASALHLRPRRKATSCVCSLDVVRR